MEIGVPMLILFIAFSQVMSNYLSTKNQYQLKSEKSDVGQAPF